MDFKTFSIWGVYGIEEPEKEYRFHPVRKWRFDYAWVDRRISVEIEGGIWSRGRHTRGGGFMGDLEKYNEATRLLWRIYRFTPQQLSKGTAQAYMKPILMAAIT